MTPGSDQQGVPDLESLARAHFKDWDWTEAELKLLGAAPKGEFAVCGPNVKDDDPANDPAKANEWSADREIRAGLIRWLCVDKQAKKRVDPKGIRVYGAKISRVVDLSYVTVAFPLLLRRCLLAENANLRVLEIPELDLQGTWARGIRAPNTRVKGAVLLRNGFHAEGEVSLLGAQIGGNLDCENATFKNPAKKGVAESGKALTADGIKVAGYVFLRHSFSAVGEVRLLGAQVGGNLECDSAKFSNPPQKDSVGSATALNAAGADVKGSVFLRNGFRAEGEVRLLGAQIGGNLVCDNATFHNPSLKDVSGSGSALIAVGPDVKGGVFLRNGFRAEGEVRLLGAQIGGNLECDNATFQNPPQKDVSGSGTYGGTHKSGWERLTSLWV